MRSDGRRVNFAKDQSRERLNILAESAKLGNRTAEAELYRVCRPLVVGTARKLARSYPDYYEDIEQCAWLGFAEAVRRFDASHPTANFKSYSFNRIRHELSKWAASNTGLGISSAGWRIGLEIDRALEDWEADPETTDDAKLAQSLEIQTRRVREVRRARAPILSLTEQPEDAVLNALDQATLDFVSEQIETKSFDLEMCADLCYEFVAEWGLDASTADRLLANILERRP